MKSNDVVLITGGTGSLGNALVDRLLQMKASEIPEKIIIFSRDEVKHHRMKLKYMNMKESTDDVLYNNFNQHVEFQIGDIRNYRAVKKAVRIATVVFHAAAMKQIPAAEYFPFEAVQTNIVGTENLINAVNDGSDVHTVVATSTDKACMPINAYGMSKALMERMVVAANLRTNSKKFVLTRYGNVMGSTGSILPLFRAQQKAGQQITVTDLRMTRYMMSLNQSVDTLLFAEENAIPGGIIIPIIPSASIMEVARLYGPVKLTGIRPGEKLHESLISEAEAPYTERVHSNYIELRPQLPELNKVEPDMRRKPYTSNDIESIMCPREIEHLLTVEGWL